jgi:hypothetical protein
MAEHIYEVGVQKVTTAAAGPIVTLVPAAIAVGVRMPEIREIGVFSVSGVAAEVGSGSPAANGTGALTGPLVQALNESDPAGHTTLVTTFATLQPTAPTIFNKRFQLQAVVGAGVIFTFLPGEFPLWAGATIPQWVLWQISTAIVTYDVYVKVAE